ncbi:hypothetical protein HMPREF7215_2486 [Pyramidobacter piscolens W5455]|uniref:Uncharacterized protein n=1 Tax=Pyramidobacter piscolens W5455 TaxID=352165 RepID=A0ABM9ZVM0_9BACT|nr:hypothetical protein HMPREF7215_2486 [Pyramidobacter piscolens W5455]
MFAAGIGPYSKRAKKARRSEDRRAFFRVVFFELLRFGHVFCLNAVSGVR